MASDEKRIGGGDEQGLTAAEWRDLTWGELIDAAFSPSSFQAGAEQMREAAAKLAESKSDRAWYAISYTSSLSQRIASTIRALPLPVAPEEGR